MFDMMKRLKEIRQEHHMTQGEFAQIIGISKRSYQNYENLTPKIPAIYIYRICDHLNISMDYFFKRNVAQENKLIERIDELNENINSVKKIIDINLLTKDENL